MKCGLFIDTEECVGCHACEIACKQEHELPVGPRLIRIYNTGPQRIEGRPQLRYKVAVCLQCTEPPCLEACPVDAISLRGGTALRLLTGRFVTAARNASIAVPTVSSNLTC